MSAREFSVYCTGGSKRAPKHAAKRVALVDVHVDGSWKVRNHTARVSGVKGGVIMPARDFRDEVMGGWVFKCKCGIRRTVTDDQMAALISADLLGLDIGQRA